MRQVSSARALLVALIVGAVSVPVVAASPYHRSSVAIDVGFFYDDLAPHGDWIEYEDYGWAFVPRVSRDWRPYSVGHWVWTDDYGWFWVSDEPFGWAAFHYGRWVPDPYYGWVWVPGYEWAPAWVSWRSGGGYIGWAPLPPRVSWQVGVGFRVGAAHIDTYIAPRHYCFVAERAFVEPSVRRHFLPVSRTTTVINVTKNVTSYHVVERRVVNRSVSVERVRRATGRAVPRVRAVEVDSVRDARRARVKRDRLAVFRPEVRQRADRTPPRGKLAMQVERRAQERQRRLERERESERRLDERRDAERRQAEQRSARQREDQERAHRGFEQRQAQERARLGRRHEADRRQTEQRLTRQREDQERSRRELEKRQAQERTRLERQRAETERRRQQSQRIVERQRREGHVEPQKQQGRAQQQMRANPKPKPDRKKPEPRKTKPKAKPNKG